MSGPDEVYMSPNDDDFSEEDNAAYWDAYWEDLIADAKSEGGEAGKMMLKHCIVGLKRHEKLEDPLRSYLIEILIDALYEEDPRKISHALHINKSKHRPQGTNSLLKNSRCDHSFLSQG